MSAHGVPHRDSHPPLRGPLARARVRVGARAAALVSLLLVAAAVTLAGCTAKTEEQKAAAQARKDAAGNELHLYNWNNYLAEETAREYEAFCKCKLTQDYYSDNEELLAKLAAGATGSDVLVPTGNAVETLIAQAALLPLDRAAIPNFGNIRPEFRNLWFDPDNRYSVPYAYSITLIGYNTARIRELGVPTDTWALIFEPELLRKIEGKITVLDSQRELFAAALLYLGYPVNETDAAKLKEARDVILRAKPYWAAFNASSYIKELTIGNIWVAHGYSNDKFQAAQDAKKANRPFAIGWSLPKEGAVLGLDNMVIHKSSPRPDLAHKFIAFMLDGKNSAELSNMLGSGNPNATAMPYIDDVVKDNKAVFPDAAEMKKLQALRDLPRKERRLLNRFRTEIKVR
jgi:spermidine/putrescine transport system substrate-binding protein